MINIDVTDAWDENKTTVSKPGPIYKLSTDYEKKVKAVNKIKNKYLRKKNRNKKNAKQNTCRMAKTGWLFRYKRPR